MTENKMEAVAKLFGKKLGEKFAARYGVIQTCQFTLNGLELYDSYIKEWVEEEFWLKYLLTGEAEIVGDEK